MAVVAQVPQYSRLDSLKFAYINLPEESKNNTASSLKVDHGGRY